MGLKKAKSSGQSTFQSNEKIYSPAELRQMAIAHLRNAKTPVAKAFRGEYSLAATNNQSHADFLHKQAKNGVWGTYIEGIALAELLNVNLVVKSVSEDGQVSKPYCLYRASQDVPQFGNEKTITIYNHNNKHWSIDRNPDSTVGDGNCLYNAIMQSLQKLQSDERAAPNAAAFFNQAVIKHQHEIYAAIAKSPTPEERQQQLQAEQDRFSKLPKDEQTQIVGDRQLALQLAQQEMNQSRVQQEAARTFSN